MTDDVNQERAAKPFDEASGSVATCGETIEEARHIALRYYREGCIDAEIENTRLRMACEKALALSAMRSEPYIPDFVRREIEDVLKGALSPNDPSSTTAEIKPKDEQ